MECPNCKEGKVQLIRKNTYYCRSCFHEIETKSNEYYIFEIKEDGNRKKISTLKLDRIIS